MAEFDAIEIRNPKIAHIMSVFDPTLEELDYDQDLHMKFFVIDFPEPGKYAIVTPETFNDHFDHIENVGITIRVKQFVTKE